jgi:branched-chain amino acid transport system substrate-binding protein
MSFFENRSEAVLHKKNQKTFPGASRITRRGLIAATAAIATRQAHAAETIKLGQIVPMSGVMKSIAEASAVAADIAVAELNSSGGVNGLAIELIRYDTSSDPTQAAVAARKLIEDDGVLAILGPFTSGEAAVAANNAERAHIAMLPSAASRPGLADGKKYLWPLATDELISFSHVIEALDKHGEKPKSAAIIYISDDVIANDAGLKTYPAVFARFDIPVTSSVGALYKTFDLSPQVAKTLQTNPDVAAVGAHPDVASKLLNELRRQGFKGRMIGSTLFSDPNNIELFGPEGNATVFASLFWKDANPKARTFEAALVTETAKRGMHKLGVNYPDAITYDCVGILATAMRQAGTTGDPAKRDAEREAINAALPATNYDGALGSGIHFVGQYGKLPGYVIEIRNGERQLYGSFPPQ